ncbi:hypothetical protein EC991_003470 [Linnemannia zychae]|nr:hypothetical protein EC991_003470 [Linnemannia zychae]
MSYVHPDDTRALCQGLDRACKALYTVFRVRWRLVGQDHLLESDRQHSPLESSKVAFVRSIEFQGESFEEYVDPTAVPDASLSSRVSNDGHTLAKYLWTEITGFLSNSQPLLVVRPLTTTELLDQANEAALATAAAAAAAASSSMITSSRRSNARSLLVQEKKGWKKKSKRMDLEEGLRLPKQINLSALTSLSMTSSSRHDELCLRMPGSLPLSVQQQQPSQQLMTATTTTTTTTRCRNPSGHANPMPSFLAFPSNATLPWSGMFVTIALDAWRQWILTVHAGQAQFQAWCEYLLEKTIDQMIESLSLGLTLLGIEEAPRSGGREDGMIVAVGSYRHHHQQQQQQQQLCVEDSVQHKTKRIEHKSCDSTNLEPSWTSFTITDSRQHQEQKAARNQQTLSGLNRAGKILEAYPSIEGVVRNIGNTWLGQKIKSRLEQKLDVVADQVVDWWEAGAEVHLAGWSPLKRAATPNGGGGGVSGAVVSELDESDVLLADAPVVVGVPTL